VESRAAVWACELAASAHLLPNALPVEEVPAVQLELLPCKRILTDRTLTFLVLVLQVQQHHLHHSVDHQHVHDHQNVPEYRVEHILVYHPQANFNATY